MFLNEGDQPVVKIQCSIALSQHVWTGSTKYTKAPPKVSNGNSTLTKLNRRLAGLTQRVWLLIDMTKYRNSGQANLFSVDYIYVVVARTKSHQPISQYQRIHIHQTPLITCPSNTAHTPIILHATKTPAGNLVSQLREEKNNNSLSSDYIFGTENGSSSTYPLLRSKQNSFNYFQASKNIVFQFLG